MVQFASYLRRVLCETRLIFSRINGPNVIYFSWKHCYAQEKSRTKVIQCPVKDAIGGGGGGGDLQLCFSILIGMGENPTCRGVFFV